MAAAIDPSFLLHARRTLLPLPLIDRPRPVETDVLGPFEPRRIASLRGKRVGFVGTPGGGAAVALVGVVRALEEAGVEPEAIAACGGSAVWGAMWAAGLDSARMAELSLGWRPQDHLDVQWTGLPRLALSALRGFAGLRVEAALEQLFDRQAWRTLAGEAEIPIHTAVYELNRGALRWFGSEETPELTLGELARIAVAQPLAADAVRVEGEMCVDGGVVDAFPAEPLLAGGGFDVVLALDLPLRAAPGRLAAAHRAELAGRSRSRLGEVLTVIDPTPDARSDGPGFLDMFLDRRRWPDLIRGGYSATVEALAPFRRRSPAARGGGRRR